MKHYCFMLLIFPCKFHNIFMDKASMKLNFIYCMYREGVNFTGLMFCEGLFTVKLLLLPKSHSIVILKGLMCVFTTKLLWFMS